MKTQNESRSTYKKLVRQKLATFLMKSIIFIKDWKKMILNFTGESTINFKCLWLKIQNIFKI